jgi:2-phosphoglycerate kinase
MRPVVLIGGASASGKSELSGPLALRLGLPLTLVDDLMITAKTLSTPQQQPALHAWDTAEDHSALTPEDIMAMHIASARALQPALKAVIADHLEFRTPFILEGDSLLPELAARPALTDAFGAGQVQAVFLSEPDEAQLIQNFLAREPDQGEQTFRAGMSVRVGGWLAAEARRLGLPVVSARPWSTTLNRVLTALGLPGEAAAGQQS